MGKSKLSIIETILDGKDESADADFKELDCLIYRSFDNGLDTSEFFAEEGTTLRMTKGDVSLQVWDSKAKIRVKVSQRGKSTFSMERIASIAMNAISEELKKEAR